MLKIVKVKVPKVLTKNVVLLNTPHLPSELASIVELNVTGVVWVSTLQSIFQTSCEIMMIYALDCEIINLIEARLST